jgi:hypothetical protein
MVKLLRFTLVTALLGVLLCASGCRFLLEDDDIDDAELNLPAGQN